MQNMPRRGFEPRTRGFSVLYIISLKAVYSLILDSDQNYWTKIGLISYVVPVLQEQLSDR